MNKTEKKKQSSVGRDLAIGAAGLIVGGLIAGALALFGTKESNEPEKVDEGDNSVEPI